MQNTPRRYLRAATLIVTAAASAGLVVPQATAQAAPPPPPPDVSNAQWLNPACTVPSTRDIKVTTKVYDVGQKLKVSSKVMLSGFEAGWVESHMNNLNCGDRDSVGVFQQRPSAGWCDKAEQCMNVEYAATKYFQAAKESEKANPSFNAGQIAQDVQKSAFPDRYNEAKDKANSLLTEAKKSAGAE